MKDKPIILVRLGDKEKRWIPSKEHFDSFTKLAEESGLTEKFNIIVFHYGIDVQLLDTKKQLEDYGLTIMDETKFKEFIAIGKFKEENKDV
jgi:hypothetical protein